MHLAVIEFRGLAACWIFGTFRPAPHSLVWGSEPTVVAEKPHQLQRKGARPDCLLFMLLCRRWRLLVSNVTRSLSIKGRASAATCVVQVQQHISSADFVYVVKHEPGTFLLSPLRRWIAVTHRDSDELSKRQNMNNWEPLLLCKLNKHYMEDKDGKRQQVKITGKEHQYWC